MLVITRALALGYVDHTDADEAWLCNMMDYMSSKLVAIRGLGPLGCAGGRPGLLADGTLCCCIVRVVIHGVCFEEFPEARSRWVSAGTTEALVELQLSGEAACRRLPMIVVLTRHR